MTGTCVIELHDVGLDTEHVVVTTADPEVYATVELVQEWRHGTSLHVKAVGDVFTFGTEGKGLGVVSYRVDNDATDRVWPHSYRLRRVS